MLSSIQTGARALPPGTGAFLVVLGDQPMVSRKTISELIAAWRDTHAAVVLPTYKVAHGHPVLLDCRGLDDILNLTGDKTLRTYVKSQSNCTTYVATEDPAVIADVDTKED